MFYLMDQPTREQFMDLARRYEDMEPDAVRAMVRLLRVGSDLMDAFDRMLGRYGLSQSRFLVLLVLNRDPSAPLSPSEISSRVGVTRATMTRLLDGLAREGLILRRPHGQDGRRQDLSLTEKGLKLLERILPDYWRRAARLMGALTSGERSTLFELLDKTASGIPELTRDDPPPPKRPGFTVRPYAPGDEEGIGALITGIQRGEYGMSITLADQPDLADIAGFYRAGNGGFWVACESGQKGVIVGTASLKDIARCSCARTGAGRTGERRRRFLARLSHTPGPGGFSPSISAPPPISRRRTNSTPSTALRKSARRRFRPRFRSWPWTRGFSKSTSNCLLESTFSAGC